MFDNLFNIFKKKRPSNKCIDCPFFGKHAPHACYLKYMDQVSAPDLLFCMYTDEEYFKHEKNTLLCRGKYLLDDQI